MHTALYDRIPPDGQIFVEPHILKPVDQAWQSRNCLNPCQRCSEAKMNPLAKSEVLGVPSYNIKAIGLMELRGIAVGGRNHRKNALAAFEDVTAYVMVLDYDPDGGATGSVIPQAFLHCLPRQLRPSAQ